MNLVTKLETEKNSSNNINLYEFIMCASKGHPHKEIIKIPYRPGLEDVTVECSNCGWLYGRPPTEEEIQSYEETKSKD